ncbi:hypothetical protein DSCO28_16870 [Desulfosarcina ovata subsp. sediminis]|uniref:Uncharacterized protein n=1 Tax=Desulfosarcina ovata subsp. sediminis TaxID=885957 RepID=A0A5K7ZJQ8_9BACT|nr:hypothetical protein [Desulfosarcina ovata]BBO81121.1 hypothetical protein DSCO28_16870 [Desulfosarcina ovata subsp. sediminis]
MNDDTHDVSLIAPSLEQVQQRFESWRQCRKKRTRIPQILWKAAAALSETYSISRLSKALRVNHTALKNQVAKLNVPEPSRSDLSPFVELPVPVEPFLESSIEMIKSDGSVMRMHIKGAGCLDLMELGRAFLAIDS